jgi:RNA polymerase sigma factor (sigma-70 family)
MVRDSILQHGFRLGRGAHGPLGLEFECFAARVLVLTRARLERASPGSPPDPARLERALAGLHLSDLYLAVACDQSGDDAFARLLALYGERARAFLAGAGVDAAQAHRLLDDLPGDLASPPPDRRARTRIGTYEGTSSLFSWLAVMLLRRRADLTRRARAERTLAGAEREAIDSRPAVAPGPADELLAWEAGERLAQALRATCAELTEREQQCFLYRYRDNLAQREIARRLAIGEPRVSRLLERATGRLKQGILRIFDGDGSEPDEHAWRRMRDSVGVCLGSIRRARPSVRRCH